MLLVLMAATAAVGSSSSPGGGGATPGQCADRYGAVPRSVYALRSCTFCYAFLFPVGKPLAPAGRLGTLLGPVATPPPTSLSNASSSSATRDVTPTVTTPISADIENETAWRAICGTLNHDECTRWRACCAQARRCCASQLRAPRDAPAGHCRRTWDGYSCWGDTPPDSYAYVQCPDFMQHSMATRE